MGRKSTRVFSGIEHPLRVPDDGSFRIRRAPTQPPADSPPPHKCEQQLAALTHRLDHLQHLFYAHNRQSLLLIFQAMDAAGKDSTVRAVLSGIDPTGADVHAFKPPSTEELAHDFLWRAACRLPERGRFGIFNRSYYEDVLIARVHPELLAARGMDLPRKLDKLWDQRFESIRDFEKHLARNGVVIVKFFLHVSRAEQRQRFLARLEDPQKYWKFSEGDVQEREYWRSYQRAYEDALNATALRHAPWYAIPADDKPYMRMAVADIIVQTLERLDLSSPRLDAQQKRRFAQMRKYLEAG